MCTQACRELSRRLPSLLTHTLLVLAGIAQCNLHLLKQTSNFPWRPLLETGKGRDANAKPGKSAARGPPVCGCEPGQRPRSRAFCCKARGKPSPLGKLWCGRAPFPGPARPVGPSAACRWWVRLGWSHTRYKGSCRDILMGRRIILLHDTPFGHTRMYSILVMPAL